LLLVLIGVIGEIICDWKEMGVGRLAKAKRISAVLLVVGLMMEFWEAAKSDKDVAAAQLQVKQLGMQIIDTSNIVAQANERIAVANENAAKAEKDAAQSNERAAKFDTDRTLVEKEAGEIRGTNFILQAKLLELEAKTQPRTITPDQRKSLIDRLTPCPKGKVFVEASFLDAEAMAYAGQITEVLKSSGFDVTGPASLPDRNAIIGESQTGIHLVIKDPQHAPKYAGYIQSAFNNSGILLYGSVGGDSDFPTNKVEIAVGQHF
jgi:hypothetical protein